jgi:hypothetical protein
VCTRAQILRIPYADTHEQLPNHVRRSQNGNFLRHLTARPPVAFPTPPLRQPWPVNPGQPRSTQVNPQNKNANSANSVKTHPPAPETAIWWTELRCDSVCPRSGHVAHGHPESVRTISVASAQDSGMGVPARAFQFPSAHPDLAHGSGSRIRDNGPECASPPALWSRHTPSINRPTCRRRRAYEPAPAPIRTASRPSCSILRPNPGKSDHSNFTNAFAAPIEGRAWHACPAILARRTCDSPPGQFVSFHHVARSSPHEHAIAGWPDAGEALSDGG